MVSGLIRIQSIYIQVKLVDSIELTSEIMRGFGVEV